jgi:hypothetical protein
MAAMTTPLLVEMTARALVTIITMAAHHAPRLGAVRSVYNTISTRNSTTPSKRVTPPKMRRRTCFLAGWSHILVGWLVLYYGYRMNVSLGVLVRDGGCEWFGVRIVTSSRLCHFVLCCARTEVRIKTGESKSTKNVTSTS